MSNFRTKAREIKAAAEAERGNFQPTGAPLRLYNYWLERTNSKRGLAVRLGVSRENFCHFWRVVAIWAPFMWFRRKAESVITHPVFVIGFVLLAFAAVVFAGINFVEFGLTVLVILGIFITGVLAVFGLMSGVSLTVEDDSRRMELDLPRLKLARWGMLFFPTSVPAYLVAKLEQAGHLGHFVIGILVVGVLSGLTAGILSEGFLATLIFVGVIFGVLIAMIILGVFVAVLSNFVSGRRAVRRKKVAQARAEHLDLHGVTPDEVYREPGRFSKFLTGVGDFLILVAQVVRVKKWKICPTVEINK